MTKLRDGYFRQISSKVGDDNYLLKAAGGYIGLHTGRNNEVNKVVRTDDYGYIQAGWINTTSGSMDGSTPTRIYASYDGYIRYMTPAYFFSNLSNSGTSISITVGGQNRTLVVNYANYASYIKGPDNRSTDNTPSWYMSNRGAASVFSEFCMSGGAWSSRYENRVTFTPWVDSSGERPVQMAFNNSGAALRTAASDSSWNSWYYILTSGNYSNYVYSKTDSDNRYVNVTGDTMTGALYLDNQASRLVLLPWNSSEGFYIESLNVNGNKVPLRITGDSGGEGSSLYLSFKNIYATGSSYTVWHAGNDGANSGLDADLLDGYHYNELPYLSNSAYISRTVNGGSANTWYRIARNKTTDMVRARTTFYLTVGGGSWSPNWAKFTVLGSWSRAYAYELRAETNNSVWDGIRTTYEGDYIYIEVHFASACSSTRLYVPRNNWSLDNEGNHSWEWFDGTLSTGGGTQVSLLYPTTSGINTNNGLMTADKLVFPHGGSTYAWDRINEGYNRTSIRAYCTAGESASGARDNYSIGLMIDGYYSFALAGRDGGGTLCWRNNSGTWYDIITSQNIGSQHVSYADSAGNADTLDNIDSSGFLRYMGWWTDGNGNNANNATGMVFAYNTHNVPGPNWGVLTTLSESLNSSYKFQLFSNGWTNGHTYYRNRSADRGGWLDWVRFADSVNTYISNGKGYLLGNEITQVNNSDTVDSYHMNHQHQYAYSYGPYTNSSGYWYLRLRTASYISEDCVVYLRSSGSNYVSDMVLHILCRNNRYWGWQTSYNGTCALGIAKSTSAEEIIYLKINNVMTSVSIKSTHSLTIDKDDYSSISYQDIGNEGLFANYIIGKVQDADLLDGYNYDAFAWKDHDHNRILPTRHDSGHPAPNATYGLTFQFSYFDSNWWNVLNMRSYSDNNYSSTQLLTKANNPGSDTYSGDSMYWRQGRNGTWNTIKCLLDSSNYTNYAASASHTHAKLVSGYGVSDEEDKALLFAYRIASNISGTPGTTDNSNAVITINRHDGGYSSQIGFGSDGRIKYRSYSNQYIVNNVTKTWNTLAYTSEIPTWDTLSGKPSTFPPSSHSHAAVDYLYAHYNSGDKPNPQEYFNENIGVKVAMTRYATIGGSAAWHDTLWINGYTGSDVPYVTSLTFRRDGTPRFFVHSQSNRATSYGTYYEVITGYNIASQSVNYATSAGSASSSTYARYLTCPDTRSSAPAPGDYTATSTGVSFDFKQSSVTGLGGYSGVMTVRPYASGQDWSGGPVHQIAFYAGGGLYHRTGTSSWGSWETILTSSNWSSYITTSSADDTVWQDNSNSTKYKIQVVSSLPSSPNSNTFYVIV